MLNVSTKVREDFIMIHQEEWRERGERFKTSREEKGFSISFVALELGISPGRVKRFEEGKPVMDSRLIETAYDLFLKYWDLRSSVYKNLRRHDWGL